MHRKNLILNFSLILVTKFLFHSPIIAQSADTSLFFRHAATFDQLMPATYSSLHRFIPDSASLELYSGKIAGMDLTKSVAIERRSSASNSMERSQEFGYTWDNESRLVKYDCYPAGDTVPYLSTRVKYLAGKKLSSVIVKSDRDPFFNDTVSFQYNRSGWIANTRYHSVGRDSDVVIVGNRMYDSRGLLLVATNMTYGPLAGTYLYEYNSSGQILRRSFATSGGIILCTDTLEYLYLNDARSVMRVSHKLKVAGMQSWTLLEEKTIYSVSGKVISYSDYNDADSNYFFRNYVQYSIRYEYDSSGRITGEYFGTIISPDAIRVRYYYSSNMQPDSIVYEEQVVTKKNSYYRVYQRDEREYEGMTGLITHRDITSVLYEEQRKKDKVPPVEIVHISYHWGTKQ